MRYPGRRPVGGAAYDARAADGATYQDEPGCLGTEVVAGRRANVVLGNAVVTAHRAEYVPVKRADGNSGNVSSVYGDTHVVGRSFLGLVPYRHYGIELPDGTMCENSPPGVRIVGYADFARGRPTQVTNPEASAAERDLAVQRALSASANAATA